MVGELLVTLIAMPPIAIVPVEDTTSFHPTSVIETSTEGSAAKPRDVVAVIMMPTDMNSKI